VEPLWLCREIVSEHLFERYFKGLTKRLACRGVYTAGRAPNY